MALKKKLEINNSGVEADYLKIGLIQYMGDKNKVLVLLDVFLSEEARASGKMPLTSISVEFDSPLTIPLQGNNIVNAYYNKIKELEAFKDAIDV